MNGKTSKKQKKCILEQKCRSFLSKVPILQQDTNTHCIINNTEVVDCYWSDG